VFLVTGLTVAAAKHVIDNHMDEVDQWVDEPSGPSRPRHMDDDDDHDEDMEGSEHDEDEDEEHSGDDDMAPFGASGGLGTNSNPFGRLARLAGGSGLPFDEATAAALFGGEFRAFGGLMSGLSNRFKRHKNDLKSKSSATRLAALRECSELLLVSNEDTLGGAFSTTAFATEFIAILNGEPNIDDKSGEDEPPRLSDEMDDDAQLAAALALSSGGALAPGLGGDEDEMECQLVACRCLAHLMEALPGTGHTLVHLGAVPVLCSKLNEISYIELAEQTLSVSLSARMRGWFL
jgi:E3 ubiquitin-protein ligase TRIP12